MKRIAPAAKLFALFVMFVFCTTASGAFDLQLGRKHKVNEYQALAVPASGAVSGFESADYMTDVTGQGTYTWPADKLPIKVWVSDGKGVPGYRPVFGQYIRQSFDWWCQASGNKLSWVEVKDAAKADITVQWTDQVSERPEGTEAGKTSCLTKLNTATNQGVIYGARMQMLTRLPGREFGDSEVSKTCLHEAGHAFGLQGHSKDRNDIMYYAIGPAQEFQLSERDKTTMARLYSSYPVNDGLALGHAMGVPTKAPLAK